MKRWLPHPILTPALAVIWLLLNNSFAPGQILLGLLLGWSIPLFTLAFWPERVRIRHPAKLLRFLAVFLYDVLIAKQSVARLLTTSSCPTSQGSSITNSSPPKRVTVSVSRTQLTRRSATVFKRESPAKCPY